ncbi:MAG: SUMF1/EgtB/PvdO family nonheme iron enzyme [Lysobacteraceae bacterium]
MRTKLYVGLMAAGITAAMLGGCGGGDEAPSAQQSAPQQSAPAQTQPAQPSQPAQQPGSEQAATGEAANAEGQQGEQFEIRRRLVDATATQEDWVPELSSTPIDNVADTLRLASQAVRDGRLHEGEGSALSLYLSILEANPDNADAKAGVDDVVARLVAQAEDALSRARFNDAARIVPIITRLRPDDPAVQAVQNKIDAGRETALQLAQAEQLAASGNIVSPDGSNAAATYRSILARYPDNQAAVDGLAKLESDLIARATAAAEAGNYAESDSLLADAGKVRPGSQTVQNASTRIVEMREGAAGNLEQRINAAIDAGQFDQAESLLGQLEAVSAQGQGVDDLRDKIRNARAYASMRPGQSFSDAVRAGGNGPEMVVIPTGSFTMGTPSGEADRKTNEGPTHRVTFSRGFALSRTEVTVGQFRAFANATSYYGTAANSGGSSIYDERSGSMADKSGIDWRNDHAGKTADSNLPVIHVSWVDAKAYAEWLSEQTGKTYRLPSESEFEYALRAGTTTRYPWGDGDPTRVVGNLTGDGDRSASRRNWVNAFKRYDDGFWGPAPVRSFEANRFGLYDMSGNVSEWVEDCWHDSYQRAPADGSAWVNPGCVQHVIRGGSWASAPDQTRSGFRLTSSAGTVNPRLGFRVARDL